MGDGIKSLWNDNVGGKVIATLIATAILAIWAWLKRGWLTSLWNRIFNRENIKVSLINKRIATHPGANYPLKLYVELRNDSRLCVPVRLLRYDAKAVTLKNFVHEIIQIRFGQSWFPVPDGATEVALLPNQLCQAWIGLEESKFSEQQVRGLEGRIGTMIFVCSGKEIAFDV